ncbi:MAG TPA: serpin family protein [Kineosporiaceae bacterium]|nr:serpin family protein [Kineosporiaceae bacterium]
MNPVDSDLIGSDLPRAAGTSAARAAAAVSAFSAELFTAVAPSSADNLVCSPYSVAVALGMVVQGARGATAAQILDVLHSDDAQALADGLNAIDSVLTADSGSARNSTEIELASGNSLWGQHGVRWEQPFLDALARDFGTGVRVVDYRQTAAARSAINDWVAQQTRRRIPELVPPGALTLDTRLTLVNAIFLKAPWQKPFPREGTRDAPFHLLDGTTVSSQLMDGTVGTRFASGPGWEAVDLPYAGAELAMAVVVPQAGRFAEVERSVSGEWLSALLAGLRPGPVRVRLPRWTSRARFDLAGVLSGMGMPIAFTGDADFAGMAAEETLRISAVLHEGFIAVDEEGTEAAAATAVMMRTLSVAAQPRSVVADRPFLYLIHDLRTHTPLFVGRVLDPTAG